MPSRHILLSLAATCLAGACSADDEASPALRATVEDPSRPVTRLELVEDMSEQVADRLLDFSDTLRRRELEAARDWLADGFAGQSLGELPVAGTRSEPLDVETVEYDVAAAPVVDSAAFLDGVRARIGSWGHVESVLWKVKGAEFQKGRGTRWGKIKLYVHMTGTQTRGGGVSVEAWGWARVEQHGGRWQLAHVVLDSLTETRRAGPLFTNVTTACGLAWTGTRFGKPGNQSFAWNGAACGDVDGDGWQDLFLPSDGRNFLYLGSAEGTFREVAEERGVARPDAGTGAVFFDFDNDGDQDLAVGHAPDGIGGDLIELYENDGGTFTRTEGGRGLGAAPVVAYSLSVLDFDGDGWLDLYVCGYGMVEKQHNNSWIEATNGAPNALFRNEGGEHFRDVAAEAGVRGTSWSYAAAAADVDGDGDADLYVANDYGTNRLYRNEGDGTFLDVAGELGVLDQGNGMGVAFGDLSGDGRLDIYVSNMSSTAGNRILDRYKDEVDPEIWAALKKAAAGNTIFFQDDGGGFSKLAKSAGGVGANWAWSSALADFDLDGRLDVFCTNGFVTGDLAHDT